MTIFSQSKNGGKTDERQELAAVRLFLLRHGPTAAPPGCLIGSTDLPLSGQGLSRLNRLTEQLRGVDRWHCSPMLRARQTLAHLQQNGCPISDPVQDERLREIDFGCWEMQTFAQIAAADPAGVAAWSRYPNFAFPQGEAAADFIRRVQEMLTLFSAAGSGSRLAAVTHGGVIRTMICLALGLPAEKHLLFDVQPASLTVLDLFAEGGVLQGLNL